MPVLQHRSSIFIVLCLLGGPASYGGESQVSDDAAASTVGLTTDSLASPSPLRCNPNVDRVLFQDNFTGPPLNPVWQASLPNAVYRFGTVPAYYLGPPPYSFKIQDGNKVLRLHSMLGATQRRG